MDGLTSGINSCHTGRCNYDHFFRGNLPQILKKGGFSGTCFACQIQVFVGLQRKVHSNLEFPIVWVKGYPFHLEPAGGLRFYIGHTIETIYQSS